MDITALWLTQYAPLVRYIARATNGRAQAEDIAQTAFVRALEHIEALRAMSPEHTRAWLRRTAINAFIDDTRRQSHQAPIPEGFEPAYEEDFSGIHVAQWLDTLPPRLRELVALRHLHGYTSAQIGQRLSMPPATVRTQLRAAMILLRRQQSTETQSEKEQKP